MRSGTTAFLLVLLLASALEATGGTPHAVGSFEVQLQGNPVRLRVKSSATGLELTSPAEDAPALEIGHGDETVTTRFGSFHFKDRVTARTPVQEILEERLTEGRLEVRARAADGSTVRFHVEELPAGTLRLAVTAEDPAINRIWWHWASPTVESFMGLGEQYNRVRHRGLSVPIWVQEQGIGRHDGWPRFPFTGRTTDSLFPMPFFVSTRGYGLFLDTPTYSVFHMGIPARPEVLTLENWDRESRVVLFDGPRPRDVIRRWTEMNGRPRTLPDWAFGVWLGVQGGPERVREMLRNVQQAGAAVDAVWVQDWIGGSANLAGYDLDYHWTWDPKLYPDLPGMIAGLHAEGVRFMGYFNTFIEQRFPEYEEAKSRGYLVLDEKSQPYVTRISLMKAAQVDLSNPDARAYLSGYLERALEMGVDGWMADFGEWLPYRGKIQDPEGCARWHNRYPVEWAKLNRAAGLKVRPDGDYVVFSRAGFHGSAQAVDLVWAGDQNTNWAEDDGIPTVIKAGLSLGLSGMPYYCFDAGGYTSLVTLPRGEELFERWVELACFSPVLRTHEGYWRQRNIQPDSNPRVLAHFARMARAHQALRPYLLEAAREGRDEGLPMMRHLWIEYPDDANCLPLEDQYLLGSSLLVAPVLEKRARTRRLYLPAGVWTDVWKGFDYSGPGWIEVEAPLGEPPAFVRQGETLVPVPLQ